MKGAVEPVVSVEPVATSVATSMAAASVAHCVTWRGENEKERNSQEGNFNSPSHGANSAERVDPHATRVSTG